MMKKCSIKVIPILAVLIFIMFVLLWKGGNIESEGEQYKEIERTPTMEEEEIEYKDIKEPADTDENITDINSKFLAEKKVREKAELMEYAGLSIEEFIEKTGIPLCQDQDELRSWRAKDGPIIVSADVEDGRIIELCTCVSAYDRSEKAIKDAVERFPYTLGGVSLNEDISLLEKNVLENASVVSGGTGYYYTSMDLSGLGIERLTLKSEGTIVDSVVADVDMSLKEAAGGLTYIWGEKVCQKEGEQNDRLTTSWNPYTELPRFYEQQEDIDKTVVWIKYPCIDIPDNPEMAQNINNLIQETVEGIENETYRKTDENIIVRADYMITYMTNKFVSITFRVYVTGNNVKKSPWQYCNINMAKNGEKAFLSDIGLTREKVVEACEACWWSVDTDSYMEEYDTNWNKYRITPAECVFYVPLPEGEEQWDGREFMAIEIFRPR